MICLFVVAAEKFTQEQISSKGNCFFFFFFLVKGVDHGENFVIDMNNLDGLPNL